MPLYSLFNPENVKLRKLQLDKMTACWIKDHNFMEWLNGSDQAEMFDPEDFCFRYYDAHCID